MNDVYTKFLDIRKAWFKIAKAKIVCMECGMETRAITT